MILLLPSIKITIAVVCRQDAGMSSKLRNEIDWFGIGGAVAVSVRQRRVKCCVVLDAGRHRGLVARGTPVGV